MCGRKATIVGNKPGVTKQKQWTKVSGNIELLDTPGVLWPKFEDEEVALNLAYTGTIKDDVIIKVDVAYNLLKILYADYKANLFERYKLTDEELDEMVEKDSYEMYEEDRVYSLMKLIAKKRGAVMSGGNFDEEKIARIILQEFRSATIGKVTLEKTKGIH